MSRIGFCGAKNTHVVVVGSRATGVARANFTHAPGPGMPLPNVEKRPGATLGCGATSSKRLLAPQVTKSRFAGRRFGH